MRFTLFFLASFVLLLGCKKDVVETISYADPTPAPLVAPDGFAPVPEFPGNPQTVEGVRLGRHLFYDKRLSGDNSQSCASCHFQENNFGDFNQFSTGIDGTLGTRNAMILSNLAWAQHFFWNGREHTLEDQVQVPVEDPAEMKADWDDVIEKLKADPKYQDLFKDAFGPDAISRENAAKALAQFIRTMVSGNSKYDRGKKQNFSNFSQLEIDGMEIFNSEIGDCFHCHGDGTTGGIMGAYGNLQFSNNGLDSVLTPNTGYEFTTGDPRDRGKFKIPSLRNVEYSYPYMHDGRFALLQDVIDHYSTGVKKTPTLDPIMEKNGTRYKNFSVYQKQALLAYLYTLSDTDFLTDSTFSNPWK